jgi:phosphate transport system substrate-binding protein
VAIRKGKCTNFGNCMNADSRKLIDVPDGADFVCPECARPLNPVEEYGTRSNTPCC